MKKKLAFLMALLLLAGCLFGCQKDPATPGEGSSEDPGLQKVDLQLVKDGKAQYQIIYPEICTNSLRNAVVDLSSKLETMTGAIFTVMNDYTGDGKPAESTGEIIVGNCKRTDTQNALLRLRQKDFSVLVTEKNILVLAWDDSYAAKAVKWLTEQLTEQTLTTSGGNATLHWEGTYTEKYEDYRYETVTVGENSLFDYRIVYPAALGDADARAVQATIANGTGYRLPIVSDSEPAQPLEILVGATNRAESQAFVTGGEKLGLLEYTTTVRNQKLVILGADEFSQSRALTLFGLDFNGCNGSLGDLKKERVSLLKNIPQTSADSYRFMQYNILVEYDGWGSGGSIKPELSYRKELIGGLLLNYAPDAAVLCEVFPGWRAILPELLGDVYAFAELDRGDGNSNRTPIIYKKDKFDLVESGYREIDVRDDGDDPRYKNYRVVTWAVLEDKSNGQRVAVFGTHWEGSQFTTTEKKQQQAAWMIEEIARITAKYESIPVIAMGDFNSRGSSPEYQELLLGAGLTDALPKLMNEIIDHIAYRNGAVVASGRETENNTKYASDHKPIWCDIKFN